MSIIARFAGTYNATEFAYGQPGGPAALNILTGTTATGAGTLTLDYGYIVLQSGAMVNVLATTAPIQVGSPADVEIVTPSAVGGTSTTYGSSTATATFSNVHGAGGRVCSGTYGLQEAINYASAQGGGNVVIDAAWTTMGGTAAMLAAASVPSGVIVVDNRTGSGGAQTFSVTLTNAQVKATNTAPPAILPAPGAGNMWDIIDMVAENVNTVAYANGGALALYYGTTSGGVLATATIAATFLTSPTVAHVIKVAGALADSASSVILNTGLVLANPTADFITGTGTMKIRVCARLLTGL